MDEKLTYTEKEALKIIGLSRPTIRKARQEGKLAYIRIGGKVLYTMSQLKDFLASSEVGPGKKLIKKAS